MFTMKKFLLMWLKYLAFNETGLFGLGMGPSGAEKDQSADIGDIGSFATSTGESAISSSNNFWQSILSGDPGQISKVLGPLMSTVNKQGQQQKKTLSEFGNRGGGTNSAAQNIDDSTRGTIDSAVASLTGGAASALGASGSSLLSTGLSAHEGDFETADTIHQQRSAQINDIFNSIAAIAGAPFTGGLSLAGLRGGKSGSGGSMSPQQIASAFGE
jgi:hypothetical protein